MKSQKKKQAGVSRVQKLSNERLAALLSGALEAQRRGELPTAEALYRDILKDIQDQPDALHYLGCIHLQNNEVVEAESLIRRAIGIHPLGVMFQNLAACLDLQGRCDEAIKALRSAYALAEDDLELGWRLAVRYLERKEWEAGRVLLESLLARHPQWPEALINLGNCYKELEMPGRAEQTYRQGLALNDRIAEAHANLGGLLSMQGQHEEGLRHLLIARSLNPALAAIHSELYRCYWQMARWGDALAAIEEVVRIDPRHPSAMLNYAAALQVCGYVEKSFEIYRQVEPSEASNPKYYANMADMYLRTRDYAQAEAMCRQALALDPCNRMAKICLFRLLIETGRRAECLPLAQEIDAMFHDLSVDEVMACGNILAENDRKDQALHYYARAVELKPASILHKAKLADCKLFVCDWENLDGIVSAVLKGTEESEEWADPFLISGFPGVTGRNVFQAAGNFLGQKGQLPQPLSLAFKREEKQKLRLGYLSADFKQHPVAQLAAEVFELHDRSAFELVAYCIAEWKAIPIQQRIRASFDTFRDVRNMTELQLAKQIAEDEIDILVDLTGYTKDSKTRALLYRPAPVQVNWLGYPGTMGDVGAADYIIGDPIVTPLGRSGEFGEWIAQMPVTYQANDRKRAIAMGATRATEGLPKDAFVLASFNRCYKYHPELFDLWCGLLAETQDAVLWLGSMPPEAAANLRREFERRGLNPGRLVIAERAESLAEHLGRIALADLVLDTFPFGGHTTTSDALWAGVPVLAMLGDTFAGRVSASLVNAAGLPELIATSTDDYRQKAQKLAGDRALLQQYRDRLAANRLSCPLFDSSRFTRDLEQLYRNMWANHCRGEHGHIPTGGAGC